MFKLLHKLFIKQAKLFGFYSVPNVLDTNIVSAAHNEPIFVGLRTFLVPQFLLRLELRLLSVRGQQGPARDESVLPASRSRVASDPGINEAAVRKMPQAEASGRLWDFLSNLQPGTQHPPLSIKRRKPAVQKEKELSKPRPQLGDAVIGQPITVAACSLPNLRCFDVAHTRSMSPALARCRPRSPTHPPPHCSSNLACRQSAVPQLHLTSTTTRSPCQRRSDLNLCHFPVVGGSVALTTCLGQLLALLRNVAMPRTRRGQQ
ncbi:hypothetical protein Y032_0054g2481 [Ancylostoma ceylanicum]|uniref:Uncharacterized protein n=1 Tax=Ancylostoma ceylanicum TaxID=53326 RepID=A0A016U7V1_9BILA|nr:hypothetical protein Y032_0054g2481 [Ancylostoma ceylanicum]